MKNIIVSLILFLTVTTFIVFSDSKIQTLCSDIISRSNKLEETIDNNDFETAYNYSVELLDLLKSNAFIYTIYLNHLDIDSIIDESVKLTVLVKSKDLSNSLVSLHLIKYNAERLMKLQNITIENIL
ncbi:DUF4363 family protein [Clostridium sp.]|uniref:DUF4363 family protein n=1 Tax=Clostridium sp. TaxID=1506 RepID=UPI0026DCC355|nr:DUF4363 family protein [Clostridium sp.]MDO5039159.1 DUF4363 family protein [Clostridium sp.]